MHGWRVLAPLTRGEAAPLVDRLSAYGARVETVRTIAVESPRTPHAMDRAVTGLVTGRYEWIGFTSANAVRAIRERIAAVGLDARAMAGLSRRRRGPGAGCTCAPGASSRTCTPASTSPAKRCSRRPDYDPVIDPINRVLLPQADIATDTLSEGLVELGWEVDDVTAYRTVRAAPPPAAVREAIKAWGLRRGRLHPSSTVRNLVRDRREAARRHPRRLHRSGHGEDGRGAWAAGRCRRPGTHRRAPRRRPRRPRRRPDGPAQPGPRPAPDDLSETPMTSAKEPRWLDAAEQHAWREFLWGGRLPPAAIDHDLRTAGSRPASTRSSDALRGAGSLDADVRAGHPLSSSPAAGSPTQPPASRSVAGWSESRARRTGGVCC